MYQNQMVQRVMVGSYGLKEVFARLRAEVANIEMECLKKLAGRTPRMLPDDSVAILNGRLDAIQYVLLPAIHTVEYPATRGRGYYDGDGAAETGAAFWKAVRQIGYGAANVPESQETAARMGDYDNVYRCLFAIWEEYARESYTTHGAALYVDAITNM